MEETWGSGSSLALQLSALLSTLLINTSCCETIVVLQGGVRRNRDRFEDHVTENVEVIAFWDVIHIFWFI
jgi:hypothetical protein